MYKMKRWKRWCWRYLVRLSIVLGTIGGAISIITFFLHR